MHCCTQEDNVAAGSLPPPHDAPLKSSLLDKPQRGFPVGSREASVRVLSLLFLLIRGVEVKRKMKEKPTNADFVKKQRSDLPTCVTHVSLMSQEQIIFNNIPRLTWTKTKEQRNKPPSSSSSSSYLSSSVMSVSFVCSCDSAELAQGGSLC